MVLQSSVGVDVSKDTLDAAFTTDGSKFSTRTYPNTTRGFAELWNWLMELSPEGWKLALEATSAYHKALVRDFAERGIVPLVLNPKQARDLARGLGILRKDDATDARVLALCAKMAWRAPQSLPSLTAEALQEISRRLDVLTRQLAAERKRLLKPGAGKELVASARRHIRWLQAEIEKLEKQWLEALAKIPELVKSYALALGVPGVGPKTARVVISELYATPRERTAKQCAAYAGVSPNDRSSGTSLKKPARTSPAGNKRLRTALYMGAVSTLRFDLECRDLYDRIIGEGKHEKLAIVAVMNKQIRRIHAVVSRGTPFVRT